MNLIEALPLGILEGVTEFLPVSSTGHLAIAEGLLGLKVDDPGVTAFTAIIQVGAILAVIIYFRSDIRRLASAWLRGLVNGKTREAPDYRFAWYVILGLIPIGIVRLSSPRPDLGASAQLVGRGGGSARGLERGDVDRRAGRQAGSPGVLAQPEGRSDHRFGAVRCPDPGVSRSRGNHQRAPVCGIWTGSRQRGWRSFSPFRLWLPPGRTRRSRKPP